MSQIIGLQTREGWDPQTYAISGAGMEVHRLLGPGFLESVYQAALEVELGVRGIPHAREGETPIWYKGKLLGVRYRADFGCFGEVLVELKALQKLTAIEEAQIINYLIATRLGRGVLLNFGTPSLQFRRFVGPTAPSTSPSVESVKSVDAEMSTP